MKGSITVEAALIVPMVNMIMIVILAIGMMYHDRCVVRGITEKIMMQEESKDKTEEELAKYIMQQTDGQLLISRVDEVTVDIDLTDVEAEVFLNSPLVSDFFKKRLEMSVNVSRQNAKGTGVVRIFTVVIEEINNIEM